MAAKSRLIYLAAFAVILLSLAWFTLAAGDYLGEPQPRSSIHAAGEGKLVLVDMVAEQYKFIPKIVSPQDGLRGAEAKPVPGQYTYDTKIVVLQGDRVRMRIISLDVPHGIAILEFGVNAFLPPEETVVVEFVADKAGQFTFFCTVFCGAGHPDHRGLLVVLGRP